MILLLPAPSVVLDAALVAAAVTHALAALFLLLERRRRAPGWIVAAAAVIASFATAMWVTGVLTTALVSAAVVGVLVCVLVARLPRFHASGALLLGSYVALAPLSMVWLAHFVAIAELSTVTRVLLLTPLPVAALFLVPTLVRTFENCESLIRREWTRPRNPMPPVTGARQPKVSIHVPAHAEPPEVVIATLDSIARLRYLNFEVLVIDNNTPDSELWQPVQRHCEQLGNRFRFIHVEGLHGAKAGALNLALDHTANDVDLIAVVDADYQVEPDFLAETVAFFEDASMGFVQTPHAYRSVDTTYLRMCDWEYAFFFATGMVGLNERNAGITVGTMCVIRREALERAGRWATWCLTEDSELAVRIHATGYSSVYLRKVYGRGLIPETFAGYRKQRFRWSYGPVSEFFAHWRLYLPGPWRQASMLTAAQRIHHATHGLYGIATGVGLLMLPYAGVVAASMLVHRERLAVPFALWLAVTVLLAAGVAIRWTIYRRLLGAGLKDWLLAAVATAALAHVVMIANLTALLGRPVPWQRTNKFRTSGAGWGALAPVRAEATIAGLLIGAGAFLAISASGGVLLMLAIGLAIRGVQYLAAPLLAILADRDLRRFAESERVTEFANTTR